MDSILLHLIESFIESEIVVSEEIKSLKNLKEIFEDPNKKIYLEVIISFIKFNSSRQKKYVATHSEVTNAMLLSACSQPPLNNEDLGIINDYYLDLDYYIAIFKEAFKLSLDKFKNHIENHPAVPCLKQSDVLILVIFNQISIIMLFQHTLSSRSSTTIVTLVSPEDYSPKPEYEKIKHYSTGKKFVASEIDAFKKTFYTRTSAFDIFPSLIKLQIDRYSEHLKVYERVSNEVNPDLFLCDFGNNEVCFDVALKLGKPAVSVTSFLLAIQQAPYLSDPVHGCSINMENESFLERLKCFVFPKIKMYQAYKTISSEMNEKRAESGIPDVNVFERYANILFLIDGFFGFEVPSKLAPIHQLIGPIMSDTYPPLAPETEKFLKEHPRTMFVALGTVVLTSKKTNGILLQSFLEAVENNVVDGVIWGLSKVKVDSIPETITLSSGKVFNTTDIINNKHPNIQILSFAPQFSILAHDNCKVFLSHVGQSSSNEAMYNGKPILALPIAFDQYGNAEKLKTFAGTALTLDKIDLTVEEVLIKIQRLLTEEKFKINAEKMKLLARINSKGKYKAADLIEFAIHSNELNQKLNSVNNDSLSLSLRDGQYLNQFISPDTRMGFIRGNYFDVYLTLLVITLVSLVISIFLIYKLARWIYIKDLFNLAKNKRKSE
ncbi:16223_t:CDS:2 [Entrophospora sp. SA101]|nr:16223_t:CDS:2 [Entrophospora sp. SA101]